MTICVSAMDQLVAFTVICVSQSAATATVLLWDGAGEWVSELVPGMKGHPRWLFSAPS